MSDIAATSNSAASSSVSSWCPGGGEELAQFVVGSSVDAGQEHVVEVVPPGHFIASTFDGKRPASRSAPGGG